MRLEINTNGAWRTVLTDLHRDDKVAEDRYLDARTAAAMLAAISAATTRKPIGWRLVSAGGIVVARCLDGGPWRDVEAME